MGPDWVREQVLARGGRPLEPGRSVKALHDFWEEHRHSREDHACRRVSTMTLVVAASQPSLVEGLETRLNELAGLYPCRTVVVVLDPEGSGSVQGWSAGLCHPGKEHQVSSEQPVFYAPGDGEQVPGLVLLGMGGDGRTASLSPGTTALQVEDRRAVANHVAHMDS